jgi:hypothetical protein
MTWITPKFLDPFLISYIVIKKIMFILFGQLI